MTVVSFVRPHVTCQPAKNGSAVVAITVELCTAMGGRGTLGGGSGDTF